MLSPNQNGKVKWSTLSLSAASLSLAAMFLCVAPKANAETTGSLSALPPAEASLDGPAVAESAESPWYWGVGIGVIACCLAVTGVLVLKRANRRAAAPARSNAPLASFSGTNAVEANTTAKAQAASAALKPRSTIFAKNGGHANGARRRKTFDYNRYFSDLMTSVSGYAINVDTFPANGRARAVAPSAEAPKAGQPDGRNGVDASMVKANSDLLLHQKSLIEDQQRLIQEQSRVIEEKSRLISEKSQLLKLQSELMESKLL